ncbi:MAG: hypothetical protein ACYDER_21680 [Ktedonobacteraceae bacterium]
MMNEQESRSNEYLRPPLWHGKIAFGKVALRLTLQKREASQKSVKRFRQASLFELDEPFEQKSAVIRCRLLVLGLYLSFLACLTGLWLTANVSAGLEHKLPFRIVNFIATQPVVVLLVPLLILLGCYFLLRLMTYEIIAWPERFLDERQQIVRDRAHRNAYKIVKVACLLVPLYLCLHAALWTAQTPVPVATHAYTLVRSSKFSIDVAQITPLQGVQAIHINPALPPTGEQRIILYEVVSQPIIESFNANGVPISAIYSWHTIAPHSYEQAPTVMAPSWPNDPTSLLLYYGTLLLSLLLMAIALPMSIVAWKERL